MIEIFAFNSHKKTLLLGYGSPVQIPNYKEHNIDNDTINTVFKRYINPLNFNVIQRMIDQSGMDKYAKKLLTPMMIRLFIYAQLKNLSSLDRKSTRLNSSHVAISYAVFCLKKKKS